MSRLTQRLCLPALIHPDVSCKASGPQNDDDVPAHINLPPAAAETRRRGIHVMVSVPVLFPRRQPKGPSLQPSEMGPPEPAMTGAGHIFDRIGLRMVISMVRDPRVQRARTIEHRCEDEHLFDDRIEFHGTMGKSAVVRHSRPSAPALARLRLHKNISHPGIGNSAIPMRTRMWTVTMVNERPSITLVLDFPPWKCSWMTFAKSRAGL